MRISKILPLYKQLYRFCKEYSDRYVGENNGNMITNGEIHLLKKHILKCTTIFDVGANKGEWTAFALSMNATASIHCFEPIKSVFTTLKKNEFPSNVHCNNFGLSSEKSRMKIYLSLQSVYGRTGIKTANEKSMLENTEEAEFVTLDSYCLKNSIEQIDMLKCDVEGHEYRVFEGAKDMLKNEKIKMIQFEYGGCNIDARVFLKDIFELLSGYNFEIFKIMPKKLLKMPAYKQSEENFIYKNFVAIHQSAK